MKEITIVYKGRFEHAVPIISISQTFNSLGVKVTVICSTYDQTAKKDLLAMGIVVIELMPELHTKTSDYCKIIHWGLFRMRFWRVINKKKPIIYIGSGDTAICLGKKLFAYSYYLDLLELYDTHPLYMRLLKKFAYHSIKNITPEINRAFIYRVLWKLSETPFVIPNKPYLHPGKRNIELAGMDNNQICNLRTKIILYQGLIQHNERNLISLAKAVSELNNDYTLVLMGHDFNYLKILREVNPYIIHIPFVPPPKHLKVTSHAYIGIVTYTYLSLNSIYCAPNKTWEYSGFGIPMLGNNIPGLINTVGNLNLGSLVDMDDKKSIIQGINKIEENYEIYSKNSLDFYNSVDISRLLLELIN